MPLTFTHSKVKRAYFFMLISSDEQATVGDSWLKCSISWLTAYFSEFPIIILSNPVFIFFNNIFHENSYRKRKRVNIVSICWELRNIEIFIINIWYCNCFWSISVHGNSPKFVLFTIIVLRRMGFSSRYFLLSEF